MVVDCLLVGGKEYTIHINGKEMRFEMNPACGPIVIGKRSEILTVQPGNKHLFWVAVSMWAQQKQRLCHRCGRCIWRPESTEITVDLGGRHYRLAGQVFQNDRCS